LSCGAPSAKTEVDAVVVTTVAHALPAAPVRPLGESSDVALPASLRGRPALVSLWATWCTACREEFSELNRLEEAAAKADAAVVGVAVGEDPSDVRRTVERERLRYRQFVDTDFRFSDALGVRRVPMTLVVDRSGAIVYVGGVLDSAALAAFRAQLRGG
jgi:thiol-disulfide isomerase/thioredoxin